jgi:hypothetical protein
MEPLHGPSLDVVKPERKNAIPGDVDTFVSCFSAETAPTDVVVTKVRDGVFYLDNALSLAECERLRSAVDGSEALTFWSPQGRDNEDVRRFRDADTIEVDGQRIADVLWQRLKLVIVKHMELCITVTDHQNDPEWERELIGRWEPSNFNHDLLFARYPAGGAFAPHTDGRAVHNFNVAYCILEHISIFFFFNGLFSASILFHAVLTQRCVAGSIIIDPSFVERWLRTHMKSSVAVHSLLVYRKGLLGIKLAAEFMRANASTVTGVDPLRLALKVRTHHQVRSVLLIMSLYYSIVHGQ